MANSSKPISTTKTAFDSEALIKLVGQPGLSDYLHFHKNRVVDGHKMDPRALVNEWRRANDHYHQLETSEAGLADKVAVLALPDSMKPMKRAVISDPYFKQSFDALPVAIKMVELKKLVVSQSSVGVDFAGTIARKLGKRPTPEKLFRFCLPLDRKLAPVKMQQLHDDKYVFTSNSTDLRDHSVQVVVAEQIRKVSSFGPISAGLLIPVGYGSNFLSAVQSDSRIILENGYHRAFALMSLGITHAPMIVQTVTRTDELRVASGSDISDDAAFYFRSARPPLLKDFLDPMLSKAVNIYRLETRIEVELKIRTTTSVVPKAV